MNNDFLDYLELTLTAEEIRELRAFQITLGGESNAGLRTAINKAKKAGVIKTASLVTIAESIGGIDNLYDANSVGALNIRKGLRTWVDAFGEVHYDQGGFNAAPDLPRYSQPQFNDTDVAKRRIKEMGGTIEHADGTAKTDLELFGDLAQMDHERMEETQALFEEIEPTKKASETSGIVPVDSSWINTIERNGDGTTTIQTYSEKGTRVYTYPDASSDAFDAMYHAHRSGTSVGKAWHKKMKDTGISELFVS